MHKRMNKKQFSNWDEPTWQLLNKDGLPTNVFIGESAYDDFLYMMDWAPEDFERYTVKCNE